MKNYNVIIDWENCDGEWVTREIEREIEGERVKYGYVIAPIQTGLQPYVEKILDDIDIAYDTKNIGIKHKQPLTESEVDDLIFQHLTTA